MMGILLNQHATMESTFILRNSLLEVEVGFCKPTVTSRPDAHNCDVQPVVNKQLLKSPGKLTFY